jgi:hypothetical protein
MRINPSMTALTLLSLPGIAWLDRTTVSCSPNFSHLLSPRAISPSADIGSPCDPVEMMQIWPGSYLSISSMSMIADSGMSSTFSSRPRRMFFFMLNPSVAILRPSAIAAVAICWMRCRWLAKLAVTMRRSRCAANSPVSTPPTVVSLGEWPGFFGVGGVGHQQPDAGVLRELTDASQIEAPRVDRGQVDLVVARVQDDALRGVDGDGVGVGDGMGDRDELDQQRTDLDRFTIGDGAHVGLRHQPRFLDAVAGDPERQAEP